MRLGPVRVGVMLAHRVIVVFVLAPHRLKCSVHILLHGFVDVTSFALGVQVHFSACWPAIIQDGAVWITIMLIMGEKVGEGEETSEE